MTVLTGSLIATGAILAALLALHGYAQWSIRNIDRDRRQPTARKSAARPQGANLRTADLAMIPVVHENEVSRQRD
jgi:hypothetical protein